jgi:hypothetical protein
MFNVTNPKNRSTISNFDDFFFFGNCRHLLNTRDPGVDGREISKYILEKQGAKLRVGCSSFRIWSNGLLREHGNENFQFLRNGEFVDCMSDYKLFKKHHASRV